MEGHYSPISIFRRYMILTAIPSKRQALNRRKGEQNIVENLLTIEAAANVLGISPWTVRAYIRDKKIIPVHIGRRVLVEPSELENFVSAAKARGPNRPPITNFQQRGGRV